MTEERKNEDYIIKKDDQYVFAHDIILNHCRKEEEKYQKKKGTQSKLEKDNLNEYGPFHP